MADVEPVAPVEPITGAVAAEGDASGERSAEVIGRCLVGTAGTVMSVVVLQVLTAAGQDVVAGLTEQDVLAVETAQDVIALPADEAVATVAPDEDVVAVQAEDEGRPVLAHDAIVAFRPDDYLAEVHALALGRRRGRRAGLIDPGAYLRHEMADCTIRHAEPHPDRRGRDQQDRPPEGDDPERGRGVAHRDQAGVARRRRKRTTS